MSRDLSEVVLNKTVGIEDEVNQYVFDVFRELNEWCAETGVEYMRIGWEFHKPEEDE